MFGILGDITKAVVGVVIETPVSVVADVVTLGGSLNDKDRPYRYCSKGVIKNIENPQSRANNERLGEVVVPPTTTPRQLRNTLTGRGICKPARVLTHEARNLALMLGCFALSIWRMNDG